MVRRCSALSSSKLLRLNSDCIVAGFFVVYNIGIKLEIPQTDGRISDVSLKGDHVIYLLLLWAGLMFL